MIVLNEINDMQEYPFSSSPSQGETTALLKAVAKLYDECTKDSELMPGRKHRDLYRLSGIYNLRVNA